MGYILGRCILLNVSFVESKVRSARADTSAYAHPRKVLRDVTSAVGSLQQRQEPSQQERLALLDGAGAASPGPQIFDISDDGDVPECEIIDLGGMDIRRSGSAEGGDFRSLLSEPCGRDALPVSNEDFCPTSLWWEDA